MPVCQETCFLSTKLFLDPCWSKISRGVYLVLTLFQITIFSHTHIQKRGTGKQLKGRRRRYSDCFPSTSSPVSRVPGRLCLCGASFHWAGHCPNSGQVVWFLSLNNFMSFCSSSSCLSSPSHLFALSALSTHLKWLSSISSIGLSGLGSFPDWILFCSFYPPLKNVSNGWLRSCF